MSRIVLLLAAVGLFISSVLSAAHFSGLLPPCGATDACERVAYDRRSFFLGLPLSIWGMCFYGGIALLAVAFGRSRGRGRAGLAKTAFSLSSLAAGLSVYLLCLSIVAIGATCPWCIASAVVALLLVPITWLQMKRPDAPLRSRSESVGAMAFCVAAALMGGWIGISRDRHPDLLDPRKLAALTSAELAPSHAPRAGYGEPTVVMFGDLVCPSCRVALSEILKGGSGPTRGTLVFRHFPVPYHATASPLAALGEIAHERGRFWPFMSHALQIQPRTNDSLRSLALSANLPPNALRRAKDPADQALENVRRDVTLAKRLGITTAPTFILLERNKFPTHISASDAISILSPGP